MRAGILFGAFPDFLWMPRGSTLVLRGAVTVQKGLSSRLALYLTPNRSHTTNLTLSNL